MTALLARMARSGIKADSENLLSIPPSSDGSTIDISTHMSSLTERWAFRDISIHLHALHESEL